MLLLLVAAGLLTLGLASAGQAETLKIGGTDGGIKAVLAGQMNSKDLGAICLVVNLGPARNRESAHA